MSRIGSGDVIERTAGNNVYTVLVMAATVASVMSLVVIYMRAATVIGGLLTTTAP